MQANVSFEFFRSRMDNIKNSIASEISEDSKKLMESTLDSTRGIMRSMWPKSIAYEMGSRIKCKRCKRDAVVITEDIYSGEKLGELNSKPVYGEDVRFGTCPACGTDELFGIKIDK